MKKIKELEEKSKELSDIYKSSGKIEDLDKLMEVKLELITIKNNELLNMLK